MAEFLGFLNLFLVLVITSKYWVRKLNEWFFHKSGAGYNKLIKWLHALHKPLAAVLVVNVFIHGWLALGALRLHTGVIAGGMLLLTALFGLVFYFAKKMGFLKVHRVAALLSVLLIALHYFATDLFG